MQWLIKLPEVRVFAWLGGLGLVLLAWMASRFRPRR